MYGILIALKSTRKVYGSVRLVFSKDGSSTPSDCGQGTEVGVLVTLFAGL